MIHKSIITILFLSTILFAQTETNKHLVGPSVGFSFLGSTLQYGLSHEYLIDLNQLGMGDSEVIGVGGIFRYWKYNENFRDFEWDYTDILLGVQLNYHFYIPNDRIDPWLGIVFAYDFGSAEVKNNNSNNIITEKDYGGFFIGANAGLKYWIQNNLAITSRLGLGSSSYAALEIGIEFKIN